MASKGTSREDQENVDDADDVQQREGNRRGSLWSRFRNLSQRGNKASSNPLEEGNNVEATASKQPSKSVVIGDVVEKNPEDTKKEVPSTPKLKDEDDDIDDGDKKPAAKVKSDVKKTIVAAVTMEEATYSNERMKKALKMLGPFLSPEPSSNETGELDSVLERNIVIKDEESAEEVVKMMRESKELSPEFKLLTIAAFRNACLQTKDLTKQLLDGSANVMIGAKIMDLWMYEATKNLEHLATTVEKDEKRWFHALTAPFIVMECLKFIWDCLGTEKKEQLLDKKKQLDELHEEFGLDWNQRDYLDDLKTCARTIGADVLVRICETIRSRLIVIMSAREVIKIDNSARHSCAGGPHPRRRERPMPRPIVARRDNRTPEEIERATRERTARVERDRTARMERIRRLEAMRAAAVAAREGNDGPEEGANAAGQNNQRLDRNARLVDMAMYERALEVMATRTAMLRRNNEGANNNARPEVDDRADVARSVQPPRNEGTASNNERVVADGEVQPEGAEAAVVPEVDVEESTSVARNQSNDGVASNELPDEVYERDPRFLEFLVESGEGFAMGARNPQSRRINAAANNRERLSARAEGGRAVAARGVEPPRNEEVPNGEVGPEGAAVLDPGNNRMGRNADPRLVEMMARFEAREAAYAAQLRRRREEDDARTEASRGTAGEDIQAEGDANAESSEQGTIQADGPPSVANGEASPENAAANVNESSEQNNNRVVVPPRAVELENGINRGDNVAGDNNERAEPAGDRLPANGRGEGDFSAAVARAAFPHIDDGRRHVFARTLRRDEERAAAMARRLDFEEAELLWGPRLPARRRLMMARRAIRGGQLDVLDVEQEIIDLDMLAYMEDMDRFEPFGFDRLARPARPQPPRRPSTRPITPIVPRHLKELRELEEAAKIKPFSITDGLELVKPSADFDTQRCFIRRVTACVGWAIHGLIFEFVDGQRMGTLMVNPGDKPMKLHDKNLADRACVGWTDIEYGDYIVGMHGDTLGEGIQSWFCYSLVLTFASGKTVHYEANHEPWRGGPFSFTVPQTTPCFVHRISFKHDQKEDMLGLVTSIHLPMSQKTFAYLPLKQQKAVDDILEIGKEVDMKLDKTGQKPMGEDVWWLILGFLRGFDLLPPSPNAKGSKEGQHFWDLHSRRFEYSLPG